LSTLQFDGVFLLRLILDILLSFSNSLSRVEICVDKSVADLKLIDRQSGADCCCERKPKVRDFLAPGDGLSVLLYLRPALAASLVLELPQVVSSSRHIETRRASHARPYWGALRWTAPSQPAVSARL
jgi:hypothetical protein